MFAFFVKYGGNIKVINSFHCFSFVYFHASDSAFEVGTYNYLAMCNFRAIKRE